MRQLAFIVFYLSFSECNDFKAGTMLRSNSRYHKLDETALFGCACRHEFPLLFLDLKHGEMKLKQLAAFIVPSFHAYGHSAQTAR